MADLLVRGASQVLTMEGPGPADLGVVEHGAVLIRDGRVTWVGPETLLPDGVGEVPQLDAGGGAVLPGFVDAHTHLVFAGDRADEHRARLSGDPYRTGGIMNSVAATRAATTDELVDATRERAEAALRQGTTTLEAKSGYGLDTETERRLLEVLATVAGQVPVR
ncbi:MAG: imidazolonepropionase, partial [Actinomycetota bacterium]|nr:imidazolonepropionase [Actinomycetota bacterium]